MEKRRIVWAIKILVLSVMVMIGCGLYCLFGYSDNRALNAFIKFYQGFYETKYDCDFGEEYRMYDCGARLIKTDTDRYQLAIFDIRESDTDGYCYVGDLHIYQYICGLVIETGCLGDVELQNVEMGIQATVSYIDGKTYFDYYDENRNAKEYSLNYFSFLESTEKEKKAVFMQSEASSVTLLSGGNFLGYLKSIFDYSFLDNTDLQIDQIKYLNKINLVQFDNNTKITGLQTENARYDVLPNGNLILSEILDKEITNEELSNILEQQGYRQVVGMGNDLFDSCYNMTQVIIPNGIQSIGTNLINSDTSNINKIELPDSVRVIDDNAFREAKNLTVYSCSDKVKNYAIKKQISFIKGKMDEYSIEELQKNRKRKCIIEAYRAYKKSSEIKNSSASDFFMVYLDEDEYPELLRYHGDTITLFTYKDGNAINVESIDADLITVMKKKGYLCTVYKDYNDVTYERIDHLLKGFDKPELFNDFFHAWTYWEEIFYLNYGELGQMQITYDRALDEMKEIAKKGTFIKPTFKALQYTYEDLSKSLG